MRESVLNRSMRFAFMLPVFACYVLTVALVLTLTSAMGERTDSSAVAVGLIYTVGLAVVVCLISAVPALALAVFLFRIQNARPVRVLIVALEVLANIPPLIAAYLLMVALSHWGIGSSYQAVVLAFVIACVPRLSMLLLTSLGAVPPQYYLAGVALGDRPTSAFCRVFLREARWDMLSSVLTVAVIVMNELALVHIVLGFAMESGLLTSDAFTPPLTLLAYKTVRLGDVQTAALAAIALLVLDVSLCFISRALKRKH